MAPAPEKCGISPDEIVHIQKVDRNDPNSLPGAGGAGGGYNQSFMGPNGQMMGPNGPMMGPNGPVMGPHGPVMSHNGQMMGPNGQMMAGPNGPMMGPNGPGMGPSQGQSWSGMRPGMPHPMNPGQGGYYRGPPPQMGGYQQGPDAAQQQSGQFRPGVPPQYRPGYMGAGHRPQYDGAMIPPQGNDNTVCTTTTLNKPIHGGHFASKSLAQKCIFSAKLQKYFGI